MANPVFRFTLNHDIEGSLQISEPIGWLEAKLTLERHEDYHSLIEYFSGSFVFYGSNGSQNGGIDFIRSIEQTYGPDATLEILIELSVDGGLSYTTIFDGQLDLTTIKENKLNQAEIAIIRNDFWAKFIARKDTPIILTDSEDLDGNTRQSIGHILLNMPSQKIYKQYSGYRSDSTEDLLFESIWDTNGNVQLGMDKDLLDEIDDKYNIPTTVNPGLVAGTFVMTEDGDYTFDLRIEQSARVNLPLNIVPANAYVQWKLVINLSDVTYPFTETNYGTGTYQSTVYTLNQLINLKRNDEVRIFGEIIGDIGPLGTNAFLQTWAANTPATPSGVGTSNASIPYPTYFKVQANTTYPNSRSQAMLIHDAVAAICDRTIGQDSAFYSEFFGSMLTNARVYIENGCGWHYALIKGLQIRGYGLDEKNFSLSFNNWWDGANPIFNLGLTYDTVNGDPIPGFTPFFLNPLNLWGAVADADFTWVGGIANPYTTATGPTVSATASYFLNPTGVAFEIGQTYKYGFQFSYVSGVPADVEVHVIIYDLAYTMLTEKIVYPASGGGSVSDTFEFVAPSGAARLGVRVVWPNNLGGVGSHVLTIDSFTDLTTSIPSSPGGLQEVIRIEEKDYFYDPGPTSIDFDYVMDIDREYDEDLIFNKVRIGFDQWKSEDISGIDDPQTKHTYATRFKKIGKEIDLLSNFIAASIAIEGTRRQSILKTKDYKFDDNVFIISINPDDVSPDAYNPELDENFSAITNLRNSDTRYNIRLTPARALLRWFNFLNNSLQNYIGSAFKFSEGEGNYDMVSTKDIESCRDDYAGPLSEKQNIEVTSDHILLPQLFNIKIPMPFESYLTIVANRTKGIGISQTNSNHVKFYIKKLEYSVCTGVAVIQAWPHDLLQIEPTDFTPPERNCSDLPCGDDSRETSEGDFRITSDGQCRVTV